VVARHDFLPFGEELNPQHEPPDKRLYTGQERDFETGQDYFGYRQLRTDLGRFLAPDPITLVPRVVGAQGVNSYAYVRNNPLRLIDPNGLDAIDLDDVEPLDLYAPGDWGEDPGDTLATDGTLNDVTQTADEVTDAADDNGTSQAAGQQAQQQSGAKEPWFNPALFAQALEGNAEKGSTGWCATYVLKAMTAGGVDPSGHPAEAYQWNSFLPTKGFSQVPAKDYHPQRGDIVVFGRSDAHKHGHVVGFDGKQWISDFKQGAKSNPYTNPSTAGPATIYRSDYIWR
jgi:RHS repeat-associated protein